MNQIRSIKEIILQAQYKGPIGTAVVNPYDSTTMQALRDGIETKLIRAELFGDDSPLNDICRMNPHTQAAHNLLGQTE